jgi:hypothetical protein
MAVVNGFPVDLLRVIVQGLHHLLLFLDLDWPILVERRPDFDAGGNGRMLEARLWRLRDQRKPVY